MSASSTAVSSAVAVPDGTTDYKPLRSKAKDSKKTHISEQPMTWKNIHKHINWLNTFFIIIVPMMGLISSYWVPLHPYTAAFSVIYYFNTGLGITAGEYLPEITPTV